MLLHSWRQPKPKVQQVHYSTPEAKPEPIKPRARFITEYLSITGQDVSIYCNDNTGIYYCKVLMGTFISGYFQPLQASTLAELQATIDITLGGNHE